MPIDIIKLRNTNKGLELKQLRLILSASTSSSQSLAKKFLRRGFSDHTYLESFVPQTPCPYCGTPHDSSEVGRCSSCNGLFEPLSQTATQLAMGPWYVRDEDRPFMPGFNEAILRQQVAAGRITANTIMRGPTTDQFWMNAADVPGVSRLMGTCHSCHQAVEPTDTTCHFCKSDLSLPDDVDSLGLRYPTDAARAQAQKDMAQAQSAKPKPTSKPTPKPKPKPDEPKFMKGSTIVDPDHLQPVTPKQEKAAAPADSHDTDEHEDEEHHDENELTGELAEDVWHAGPASTSRRRKRQKGADPLVLGMGVVLLCVLALGGMIILTSDSNDDDTQEEQVDEPVVQRDSVAVSIISVPALTAYERLVPEDIPAEFEDQYKVIRRLKEQADADKKAERYDLAYAAYKELGELVTPLENDIANWQANELAKADANQQRELVLRLRQQAQAAEAEQWAAKEWQEAQTVQKEGDQLFTAGQFAQANDLLSQAETAYLAAANKAQAGQAAGSARTALIDAMKAGGSQQTSNQLAKKQIDAMLRYRGEADQHLNDQRYAQAEQSYNNALDALREAEQIVEMARYKKFYTFDAGFRASALMLAAARGDGVDSTAQRELAQVFDTLRIRPNPASGITPGDDVGFTVAIQPLINEARDAIAKQHGEAAQACYLIGFHASIIDQTLKTTSLTDDQQKRIHQSLGTIAVEAEKAGWDVGKLRPMIEEIRSVNRRSKVKSNPEPTRAAWKKLLSPIQSRSTAPGLMNPSISTGDPSDPELFPTNGS